MSALFIILGIFVAIIIVLLLITIHELGHFVVAKLCKVYVYEFSIGFGPKIVSWGKGHTKYVLRWIPLGGFVHIASELMDPPERYKIEDVPEKAFIEQKPLWQRLSIISSGALINLFLAIFLLTILFSATGMKAQDTTYWGATYSQNSPIQKYLIKYKSLPGKSYANFKVDQTSVLYSLTFTYGDNKKPFSQQQSNNNKQVVLWNSRTEVSNYSDSVQKILKTSNDIKKQKPHYVWITRTSFAQVDHNKKIIIPPLSSKNIDIGTGLGFPKQSHGPTVLVSDQAENDWKIGISAPNRYFTSAGEAYGAGWTTSFEYSISLLKGFQKLFTGNVGSVQGPIGIVSTFVTELKNSALGFFQLVALISANLFIFNILPIPPLDGFRFWETIVEKAMKREIPEKIRVALYMSGAIFFVLFIIAIMIVNLI